MRVRERVCVTDIVRPRRPYLLSFSPSSCPADSPPSIFLFQILEALLHGGRMGPVIIGTCKKGTSRPASTLCAALKIRHWVSDAQN